MHRFYPDTSIATVVLLGLGVLLPGCEDQTSPRSDGTVVGDGPSLSSVAEPASQSPALPDLASFDRTRAYVASIGDGVISAIDLQRNEISWNLRVSEGADDRSPEAAMGIAASPDGQWVYSGDAATDEVVVVDADQKRIVDRIRVPHQVHAIDICENGHILWVSGRHPDYPWLSRTSIVDASTRDVIKTFTPGLGNDAHYAFTPDASEVWGASVSTNLLSVYDAHSGEVLAAIPLAVEVEGTSPEAEVGLMGFNEVAISPDGTKAYVVGPESGTVFSVDVAARKVLDRLRVGERTHGVAVSRDGHEIWTANNAGTVTILDATSLTVRETLRLHDFANEMPFAHVAFSYDGERAYVSFASDIAVIDVMTREVLDRIDIGTDPHEISLEDYYVGLPEGRRVTPEVPGQSESPATVGDEGRTVESRAAGITITADLLSVETSETGRTALSFRVALDTHAGDLMDVDFHRQVSVEVDGREVSADVAWIGESESVHHRKGILRVAVEAATMRTVTLVFRDVGVETRELEFAVPVHAG